MHGAATELGKLLAGDVVDAARALLGCNLIRGGRRARIVEVEAYRGRDDPGSHAYRGPTPRNQVMYGPPGHAYVYFTYGCHWMLNVVAEREEVAAAVLIRAAEPLDGLEEMRELRSVRVADAPGHSLPDSNLLSGPGKLAAAFGIGGKDNGCDLLSHHPLSQHLLRIEPGPRPHRILSGTRIGLAHGKGHDTLWRFADADALKWVSRPLTFA